MGPGPAAKIELAIAALAFAGLCRIFYFQISMWRENAQLYRHPAAGMNLWTRLRVFFNPGQLYRRGWTPAHATVQQTFLVRRDVPAAVGPDMFGLRHYSFWKTKRVYGIGFWYRYTVGNTGYWGEHRPSQYFLSLHYPKQEAREQANALLGTEIAIRYDPDLPEDSRPVFGQNRLLR